MTSCSIFTLDSSDPRQIVLRSLSNLKSLLETMPDTVANTSGAVIKDSFWSQAVQPKLEYSVESPLNREPPIEDLISRFEVSLKLVSSVDRF